MDVGHPGQHCRGQQRLQQEEREVSEEAAQQGRGGLRRAKDLEAGLKRGTFGLPWPGGGFGGSSRSCTARPGTVRPGTGATAAPGGGAPLPLTTG